MGIDAELQRPGADERFVVRGKLGAGGMGVVYRALDRAQQREVALKTLKAQSARDLYRFKREFRSLCDLAHPNLCALYELHTSGDEWFFTMELIRGCNFLEYVRPGGRRRAYDTVRDSAADASSPPPPCSRMPHASLDSQPSARWLSRGIVRRSGCRQWRRNRLDYIHAYGYDYRFHVSPARGARVYPE